MPNQPCQCLIHHHEGKYFPDKLLVSYFPGFFANYGYSTGTTPPHYVLPQPDLRTRYILMVTMNLSKEWPAVHRIRDMFCFTGLCFAGRRIEWSLHELTEDPQPILGYASQVYNSRKIQQIKDSADHNVRRQSMWNIALSLTGEQWIQDNWCINQITPKTITFLECERLVYEPKHPYIHLFDCWNVICCWWVQGRSELDSTTSAPHFEKHKDTAIRSFRHH